MRNGYSDPTANAVISKLYREWLKTERERKAKEAREKAAAERRAKVHGGSAA